LSLKDVCSRQRNSQKLLSTAQAQSELAYLVSARAAARWIIGCESEHLRGRPDEPVEQQFDLYYGCAGKVLFFWELAELTGDRSFREIALTGAACIAGKIDSIETFGLYHGLAGVAVALDWIARTSGNSSLLNPLNLAVDRLQASVQRDRSGALWNEWNDLLSGTAGIGLALIYLARQTGRPSLMKLARAAGDGLVGLAHETRDGNHWTFSKNCSAHFPNFSHGTAGVGYFLAELYEVTREERYRESALTAGCYLRSVASKAEASNCLIFHDDAAGRDLFYLGWCHGPAGTSRFFYRLYQLTDDADWLGLVERQAATLMASGMPERQTPGYWNNVSRCCGAAGVGELFLGLYIATSNRSHLAFAEHIADYLVARAETEGNGIKWPQAETCIDPDRVAAQTGLMQGAAGIGLFLVHLDEVRRNRRPLFRFPDEPLWGERARRGRRSRRGSFTTEAQRTLS
jgi:lantibiotic modifying enzyme